MHIKQLIVRGFKSYKDEIVLGPFSPGHNVIVGRNGSGKSNLFKAISFVLSDEFSKLGQMDRASLLYNEGQGDMTAFVEIVLDNTGGRQFPIDSEEVRIRRTIGMKKDEYFLDSKLVKKSDITALLESAGFSKSNPYNIVQQGKIQQLSEMNDSKRLLLLKELAGAHVYDERRKESLRIMEESDEKMQQVSEMLQFIEKRLEELEAEKEELREYLELDKQRRSLEYSINKKSLDKRQSQVAKIEKERELAKKQLQEKHEGIKEEEDRKKAAAEELKKIEQEQNLLSETLDSQKSVLKQIMEQKTELELDVRACKENASRTERRHRELSSKKAEANVTFQKLQKKIQKAAPEIAALEKQERELLQTHRECKREYEALVVKQGRHTQFKSKKERDAWIQNSIRELEAEKKVEEARYQQLAGELERVRETLAEKEQELGEKVEESSLHSKREQALISEIGEITTKWSKQRDVLNNQRRELAEVSAACKAHQESLHKSKSQLLRVLPQNISKGLQYLEQMPEKPKGFFGPLIDLVTCEGTLFSAVQAIAGNQLFSIVVDSHKTASALISKLQEGDHGRLTFMPLDKLRPKEVDLPQDDFVLPLMSRLTFDPEYTLAVKQVFGRVLLCRDNETAKRYRSEYKVDCVTLEGEYTNRRGPITGGYVNEDEGRLKLQSTISSSRRLLSEFKSREEEIQTLEAKAEQELAMLENSKQTKTAAKAAMAKDYGHLRSQIQHLREETTALSEDVKIQTALLQTKEVRIEELKGKIAAGKSEMKEELVVTLSPAETALLARLNAQDTELRQKCQEVSLKLAAAQDVLSSSEKELEVLKTQQEDVEKELKSAEVTERVELQQKESLLKSLEKKESDARKAFDELEERNRKIEARKKKQKEEFEACKKRVDAAHAEIKDTRATCDRLHDQLSQISAEQQDLREKLRQLGTISESALRDSEESVSAMKTRLVRVNDELKKFQHVNKKAMDQFASFTTQRDEHTKRREVMEKSAKSIRDLIENLDRQKDNAIDTSFKMVVKNFQDVFKAIVRKGRGTLIMKRGQKGGDAPEGAAAAAAPKKVEYTGIGIKVCFDGVNEVTSMTSLSGGQKTVVALALIFAIQKMDPAPFYLFDEVDAALDPIYRSAVANMISAQAGSGTEAAGETSNKAQFICTTFQRELLDKASQIWFVSMGSNKQSRVERTARDEAHRIIADASKETIAEEE